MGSLKRIGLLVKNVGHSTIYSDSGCCIPVTLLFLSETCIVDIKEKSKCGYNSVILGTGNLKKIARPQLEYLKKRGINKRYKLYESRLNDLSGVECGKKIEVKHFLVGQYLDITGYSIGKGFAGVIKRYNFSGLRASHGVSISHRSQGSTGQCQDPGRVFKGKKMPGHLGSSRVTVHNMKILSIDYKDSLIAVKGNNVPGFRNSYVFVRDAVKKPLHRDIPI